MTANPNEPRIQTFQEFWPYYLNEHKLAKTRKLHFFGTSSAIAFTAAAALLQEPALIALALISGYGPAWFAHYRVEHNRPATFKYPFWSLAADFKMWWYMLTKKELR